MTFNGTDGASGVKECSPAVEYKGPDANPAKLVGQCRDHAGHLSAPVTFELRYDGTKPPRPKVRLRLSGGAVTLAWTAAKDVVLAQVIRAPGLRGRKPAELYRGKLRRFVDAKAKPNLRYWYEVRLFDQAGNRAARAVSRKPLRGVYAPAEGAVVRREPAVAWVGVPRARFYNLQLWAGRRKLLTTWLAKTTFVVPRTWTYQGKRHRLRNGAYTAFVWPAYGTPKNPKYGDLVGRVRFVVKRS